MSSSGARLWGFSYETQPGRLGLADSLRLLWPPFVHAARGRGRGELLSTLPGAGAGGALSPAGERGPAHSTGEHSRCIMRFLFILRTQKTHSTCKMGSWSDELIRSDLRLLVTSLYSSCFSLKTSLHTRGQFLSFAICFGAGEVLPLSSSVGIHRNNTEITTGPDSLKVRVNQGLKPLYFPFT